MRNHGFSNLLGPCAFGVGEGRLVPQEVPRGYTGDGGRDDYATSAMAVLGGDGVRMRWKGWKSAEVVRCVGE